MYKIVGLRGSGKSVEYGKILNAFRKKEDWLVYSLSAAGNLTETLIAKLSNEQFIDANEHATSFSGSVNAGSDIKILKEKNVTVVTCPASNMKLASGVADIMKLRECGINVAIGTDGPASNNQINMFKEMHIASLLQKGVNGQADAITAMQAIKMATINGAKAMGLKDCDVLDVGKYADIIMIDLKNPAMQPINNIAKNIVYSGSKDCVKMTMINGKVLYYNHEFFIDEDYEKILEKVQEVTERLKKHGK